MKSKILPTNEEANIKTSVLEKEKFEIIIPIFLYGDDNFFNLVVNGVKKNVQERLKKY